MISFTFLTLIGFFCIKLYKLLFPSCTVGAFIAFSIYLMHPSLSISRLTFMHFDFAYVFFFVLSLYLFVLFCQHQEKIKYFIFSLISYAIAITFKEPAIMLGPVLFIYYCIFTPWNNKKFSLFILFSITAVSALLSWYLFLSWPSLQYAGGSFNLSHSLGTLNVFFKDVFGIHFNLIPYGSLPYDDYAWRTTLFTPASRFVMWIFFWLSLTSIYSLCNENTETSRQYLKSILFLMLSGVMCMALPLCWASGAPWHHSLTLIFLSFIMGFSGEQFLRKSSWTKQYVTSCCIIIIAMIAWISITINFENIIKYYLLQDGLLGISLNRNAILSPPNLQKKLDVNSILVVEDSQLHNDYFLGNSAYPFLLFFTNKDYDDFQKREENFYFKFQPVYGGNLFRYAYLEPSLKEELYPFQIESMDNIPNEIIYNWLQHINNIFCVGYDAAGNWQDKTERFKTALLKQKSLRHLVVRQWQSRNISTLPKKFAYTKSLPFPDKQLCEFTCDQDSRCKGFSYQASVVRKHYETKCYFSIATQEGLPPSGEGLLALPHIDHPKFTS